MKLISPLAAEGPRGSGDGWRVDALAIHFCCILIARDRRITAEERCLIPIQRTYERSNVNRIDPLLAPSLYLSVFPLFKLLRSLRSRFDFYRRATEFRDKRALYDNFSHLVLASVPSSGVYACASLKGSEGEKDRQSVACDTRDRRT